MEPLMTGSLPSRFPEVVTDPAGFLDEFRATTFGPNVSAILDNPLIRTQDFHQMRGTIILMGGTFDMFTYGHLVAGHVSRFEIMSRLGLDPAATNAEVRFVYVPVHQNPEKSNAPMATDEQRLTMIAETIKHEPGLYVTNLELQGEYDALWDMSKGGDALDRRGASYTATTVDMIRQLAPGASLYLVVGADYVPMLHRWHRVSELMTMATFAVEIRAGHEDALRLIGPNAEGDIYERAALLRLGPDLVQKLDQNIIHVPKVDIAASALRAELISRPPEAGLSELAERMLPESVKQYILNHPEIYFAQK